MSQFTRRAFLASLAVSAVSVRSIASALRSPTPEPRPCCWVDGLEPKRIAIVGDVQRTSIAEVSFMGRKQNDPEREAVLRAIAGDRPDMVLMLGDQVVEGDDDNEWSYFDRIMSPINDAGIPVRSILGNHDYGRRVGRCMHNCNARFPYQSGTPNASLVRLGGVGLVTVNSNYDRLSVEEIAEQAQSYTSWLTELDSDETIKSIIVASHHPPYTNSDIGPNDEMIRDIAIPFAKSRKTRLYLSGHVHSYERFVANDKTFVISGGGGGPRRSVDISDKRPYTNDAYRIGRFRPFHYIMLTVSESSLDAEVMMLQQDRFVVGDRFSLSG